VGLFFQLVKLVLICLISFSLTFCLEAYVAFVFGLDCGFVLSIGEIRFSKLRGKLES